MSYKTMLALLSCACLSLGANAIDFGDETIADKADSFDFEEFHKEKGIVIWEEKNEKTTTTYEESEPVKSSVMSTNISSPAPAVSGKTYEEGQELKVREAYKLGNDPALRNIPSLYEAIEGLHKQLNSYCPQGWSKDKEWHKPEQNNFYIHYSAVCL